MARHSKQAATVRVYVWASLQRARADSFRGPTTTNIRVPNNCQRPAAVAVASVNYRVLQLKRKSNQQPAKVHSVHNHRLPHPHSHLAEGPLLLNFYCWPICRDNTFDSTEIIMQKPILHKQQNGALLVGVVLCWW